MTENVHCISKGKVIGELNTDYDDLISLAANVGFALGVIGQFGNPYGIIGLQETIERLEESRGHIVSMLERARG